MELQYHKIVTVLQGSLLYMENVFGIFFLQFTNEAFVLQKLLTRLRHLQEHQRFTDLITTIRDRWLKFRQLLLRVVKNRRFQYSVGALVAFFLLVNYAVMPWYVYHGGTLPVPEVTGHQYEEALNILSAAGLVGIPGDTVLDNSLPVGSVVTQNPKSNAVVKYGRHVYLTICGGEVQVNVPMMRGRSLRDAKFAIERNGLLLGEVQYASSDSSPVNTIISQSVAPMQKVRKGTAVGLTVSTGHEATSIEVPDLTGKSLADAHKVLMRLKLNVGKVTEQISNELLPNTVVDQFPKPGSAVEPGKSIDLFVVKVGKVLDEH